MFIGECGHRRRSRIVSLFTSEVPSVTCLTSARTRCAVSGCKIIAYARKVMCDVIYQFSKDLFDQENLQCLVMRVKG